MKKVLVLMGSPRKKDGYAVCRALEERTLEKRSLEKATRGTVTMANASEIEFEYVTLSKLRIEDCRGCELCLTKGEDFCPIGDDIAPLRKKIAEADALVIDSPVYACHVSGTLKKTVDRLSYLFHRPKLAGKPAVTIATTGGGALGVTQKYLKMIAVGWGCHLVAELGVIAPFFFENRWGGNWKDADYTADMERKIARAAERLVRALADEKKPTPSFYDLYMFNGLKSKTFTSEADAAHWKRMGWIDADYYYPVRLNPLKRAFTRTMGAIVKSMVAGIRKKAQRGSAEPGRTA